MYVLQFIDANYFVQIDECERAQQTQTSMSWKMNMNACMWGQTTGCTWGREGGEEDERMQITCVCKVSPAHHGPHLIKQKIIYFLSLDTIRVWDSNKCHICFHPTFHSINSKQWAQNKCEWAWNRHKWAQLSTNESHNSGDLPIPTLQPWTHQQCCTDMMHTTSATTTHCLSMHCHHLKYLDSAAAQLGYTTEEMVDILAEQERAERGVPAIVLPQLWLMLFRKIELWYQ